MKAEKHVAAFSGIIPALQAANSVWFAFRNSSTTRGIRVRRVEAMARSETAPTATDQFALEARWANAFPANFTGGTNLSDPAAPAYFEVGPESGHAERRPGLETLSALGTGDIMIANTSALATATPTLHPAPFAWDQRQEGAAATVMDRPGLNLIWTPSDEAVAGGKGRVLRQDTGFIIRNPLATGAGHTWRLFVRVAWEES